MKTKQITASKLGMMGGKATKKKYGKEHFSMLAKKRWKAWRKAQKLIKKQ